MIRGTLNIGDDDTLVVDSLELVDVPVEFDDVGDESDTAEVVDKLETVDKLDEIGRGA